MTLSAANKPLLAFCLACAFLPMSPLRAQQEAAATATEANTVTAAQPNNPFDLVDVEIIRVGNQGTVPHEIHRKPGKFLIQVISENSSITSFTVEPESGSGSIPFVSFTSHDPQHLSAPFNATKGRFRLKSATGQVLCKIVVE